MIFNSLKQSRDFDKEGKYIKMWCPELKTVPLDYLHDPWNMPQVLQKQTGVTIDQHYPNVIACLKYTNPDVAKKQKRDATAKRNADKVATAKSNKKITDVFSSKEDAEKARKKEAAKLEGMVSAFDKHMKSKK